MDLSIRTGVSPADKDETFKQHDAALTLRVPWNNTRSGITFTRSVEISLGALYSGPKSALIGSIGPGIGFIAGKNKLFFDIGSAVTLLSRYKFEIENFGGIFQFKSYIRISFTLFKNINIGYRFQHMSNAEIFEQNPGLNLNMIKLGYSF